MPIDFSDPNDIFTGFSGSGFAFNIDPEDSNNQVGQFFNDASDPWQGFSIDLIRSIDMDFQQEITKVKKNPAGRTRGRSTVARKAASVMSWSRTCAI